MISQNEVIFKLNKISTLSTITLIILTLLLLMILTSESAVADIPLVSDIQLSVPISCNMTSTVDTAHNAIIPNGTYEADIGQTTLKVLCNDSEGFSIYAIGYTGETYGTTTLVGQNQGGVINTGTNTSSGDSSWAMKLTKVTDTSEAYQPNNLTITNSFDDYHIVPSSYTQVASYTSSTDATLGSKLRATYVVYASGTQLADTYNGKVKYTLVHPYDAGAPPQPVVTNSGYISYNPNASGVTDSMGDQSISSTDASAKLWATNFRRQGYGFAGWSDQFDYDLNSSNNTGHIYGPNETITFTAGQYSGDNPGLSLYAVWVKSAGNLQGWTGCSSLEPGKVTALTDTRDNDTYAVAKLSDGKCWMIENLRLDTANSLDKTKSSTGNYGGKFSGLADPEMNSLNGTTPVVANSRYKSDGSGDEYDTTLGTLTDIGTEISPAYRMPRYRNDNTSTDSNLSPNINVANMTSIDQNIYSYGNYYSWHAAIADTTPYTQNNTNVNTSLCPLGWRLPKGGNKSNEANNEIWGLVVNGINGGTKPANYSSQNPYYTGVAEAGPVDEKIRTWPNNFVHSGFTGSNRGARGYYWSSATYDGSGAYTLRFYNSTVYPGTYFNNKYGGSTIRCVTGS
ncbi:hypothetical protein IIY24_00915 [Candidatus Saccharibacteria bacterium]|nr:hypothetical protein [Candidatus Saccharibacteria bacterium]